MRYFNGLWIFKGKVYTTLKAALQAAWIRTQASGQKDTAPSVTGTESGKDPKATQTY